MKPGSLLLDRGESFLRCQSEFDLFQGMHVEIGLRDIPGKMGSIGARRGAAKKLGPFTSSDMAVRGFSLYWGPRSDFPTFQLCTKE